MIKTAIVPQYRDFKGWETDITQLKQANELPEPMKKYIAFINDYLGVRVGYISNGPGREQIIKMS